MIDTFSTNTGWETKSSLYTQRNNENAVKSKKEGSPMNGPPHCTFVHPAAKTLTVTMNTSLVQVLSQPTKVQGKQCLAG